MKSIDKNYLSLQFNEKIYSKNGTEFQSFFENLMIAIYPNFEKIPSGGGDGGNDGWIKKSGIYYQVYAPHKPALKDSDAADKLEEDFYKILDSWDDISTIKEYYFVFNDKFEGTKKLNFVISDIEKKYPNIKFDFLLAKNLKQLFDTLDEDKIIELEFNMDSRDSHTFADKYLKNIELDINKEVIEFAQQKLKDIEPLLLTLEDSNLFLTFRLLECQILRKLEQVPLAIEKYQNIILEFPDNPTAFLYLAEIYICENNFKENDNLIQKAEAIDDSFWLLEAEKIVRKNTLNEEIDLSNIDESKFTNDKEGKASLYRLYSVILNKASECEKAMDFINMSITLCPYTLRSHHTKLCLMQGLLNTTTSKSDAVEKSTTLLKEIDIVINKFSKFGTIRPRYKALLSIIKLNLLRINENFVDFDEIHKEALDKALECYLDKQNEQILTALMSLGTPTENELDRILEYLISSGVALSDNISKQLVFQLSMKNCLLDKGKKFFNSIDSAKFTSLIEFFEKKDYNSILDFIGNDTDFAILLANSAKKLPDLRKCIIDTLPSDQDALKVKLTLLLHYEENQYDEAFALLQSFDLSNLSYMESIPILNVILEKKAWDSQIVVINELLKKQISEDESASLKTFLFNAYYNLNKFNDVIKLGEELLNEPNYSKSIDNKNKENLLGNTLMACLQKGKVDPSEYAKATKLLTSHYPTDPTFEFKVSVETEVYLKTDDYDAALQSIIDGIKIKKVLTSEEYAKFYFLLFITIGKKIKPNLDTLDRVDENHFVKLKDEDKWFFIGADNSLDALKISLENTKFNLFKGAKLGSSISFAEEYNPNIKGNTIELIFDTTKYILWQSLTNFNELSSNNLLDYVKVIHMPNEGDTPNIENLLKFLESQGEKKEPFFKKYHEEGYPLALLAYSEGGIVNAIGRINNEDRGFINCNTGNPEDFTKQQILVKNILEEKLPFYIDTTSALFIIEYGLFDKVYSHFSNIKIPQSVMNFLIDHASKFNDPESQHTFMRYAKKQVSVTSIGKDKATSIYERFVNAIKLLESEQTNISDISLANKSDCFSESRIHAELCDACILAQKERIPILTDDFLYLRLNEVETGKEMPEYFSSIALVRVLYESKIITYEEYLDFFGYLSTYRIRFLTLDSIDIERSFFGDGDIKDINYDNYKKLNFPFTLSEEYGVPFNSAFTAVAAFFYKVLKDDTVSPEIIERIFLELIEAFPTKLDKWTLSQILIRSCLKAKESEPASSIILNEKTFEDKIKKIIKAAKIHNLSKKIWSPDD